MAQHILKIQRRMQDTWSNHMQVQRGNPIRTYSGTDFKKNYQDKSFKKQRQSLKKELKNYRNELN